MDPGEIAAGDLIVGGRMGIPATAAAADRADRLDRDTAQDIVQHRRIAIDGPAIAAIARSFAKLPAPVRHADRIDRPGETEVRFGFADEHGRSEEHTSELQSLMRSSYAVFCLKKKQSH